MANNGRKIVHMKPDGNCFYRSISYQLFGTQEEDCTVRSVITRMENLNKKVFSSFLIHGANKDTIEEHIHCVSTEGTWATQVDVVATATVFEIPVYFCVKTTGQYVWNVIKPLKCKTQEITLPTLPELDENTSLLQPDHFELFYHENSHYDAIVSVTTGKVCLHHPTMLTYHSKLVDLTD